MTETSSRPAPSFAGSTSTSARKMRVVTDVPSFTCPFTSSPSVISPRRTTSPSPSRLSFPKMPVPSSSVCSTDSEILSDFDPRLSSPSLITSLFSRNPSSSCSTSSNPTPVTPTCGAKPILRRPGPECASTSTSASEDCGKLFERVGLGLSTMQVLAATEQKHQHQHQHPGLGRKRSTLTFAVKCPVTSDSACSPVSSFCRPSRPFSRSPCAAKLPAWHGDDDVEDMDDEDEDEDEDADYGSGPFSPLFEEESDDDEGYQEDSEGGFTSDEECVGTFTDLPRIWVPSARWKATQSTPRRRGESRSESFTNTCTSDDGSVVYRPRGRKIMIATNKPDRCSRHVSPPPSRAASPTRQSACPPAARSPSAIGLCRRRETAEAADLVDKTPLAGWRSDVPVSRGRGSLCPPAGILRKGTAPVPGVRRTYTQTSASTLCSTTNSRPCEKESLQLKRRVSAPACSAVSTQRSGCQSRESDSAREGLEAYLRRGSARS